MSDDITGYDQPVTVTKIHVPGWSTLGYGFGQLDDGTDAVVVGESRAMAGIGQALGESDGGIVVRGQILATGDRATQYWDHVSRGQGA